MTRNLPAVSVAFAAVAVKVEPNGPNSRSTFLSLIRVSYTRGTSALSLRSSSFTSSTLRFLPPMSMPPRLLTSSIQISTPRDPDCACSAKVPADDTVMPMRIGLSACAAAVPAPNVASSAGAASASRNDLRCILFSFRTSYEMRESLPSCSPKSARGKIHSATGSRSSAVPSRVDAVIHPFGDQGCANRRPG